MNTNKTKFLSDKSLKNRILTYQQYLNTIHILDLYEMCKQHTREFYLFCLDINEAFENGMILKDHPYFDYLSFIKICFLMDDTKDNFDKYFSFISNMNCLWFCFIYWLCKCNCYTYFF